MSETALLSIFHVQLGNQDAPAAFMQDVDRITVETSLHLPAVATIVLFDSQLTWIDHPTVWPGTKIKIQHVSEKGAPTPLFDGEIVELEPDFRNDQHWLTIRAFDALHRLARGRHARTFQNVKDSDLATQLIGEVGVAAKVDTTPVVYDHVWQANDTNLDFLRRRAALNGYLLHADGMKICFQPPPTAGGDVTVTWGEDLTEFHACLSTVDQITEASVLGWDVKEKKAIVGKATSAHGQPQVGASQSGGKVAESAHGITAKSMVATQPVPTQQAANQIAQAHLNGRASRYIEASGSCVGNPQIHAGTKLKIDHIGNRFKGTYVVTAATHLYGPGMYITDFSVTSATSASLTGLMLLEEDVHPVVGPAVAIVTDNNDPEGMGRVKVKYPWLSQTDQTFWARVVSPGAGKQRGLQFLPEVNDEVLVDFDHGDINYPYVLGGMWNGKDGAVKKNAQALEGGNVKLRYIQTRAGHVIILDDTNGKGGITIQDKDGDKIILDSSTGKGGITIEDKVGNKIRLDSMGKSITIEALQDLTVKANAQLKLQGATVSIQGQSRVEMKGLNVTVEGETTTTVKGTVQCSVQGAEVSVQGQALVQVQGAIVKLN